MRNKSANLIAILLIILIVLISLNTLLLLQPVTVLEELEEEPWPEPEISDMFPHYIPVSPPTLEGFVPVEIDVIPGIIYLTHNCTELTMITTESQTYSIDNGIRGVIDPRPTPHDLMKEVFENWNITVTMARIERFEVGTYYATLVLERGNQTLLLDCRPSDSIATAIRFAAPIYINEEMLKEHGREVC